MTQHLDENAELYALGDLEPDERAAVEQHIATCATCAQRVADAEGVVAALASTLPSVAPAARHVRLRSSPWLIATAAVVALGFAILGWEESSLRYERANTTVALQTIVHSHFLHIMMDATSSASPNVKVLYARDGAWIYVVADAERSDLRVILTRDGVARMWYADGAADSLDAVDPERAPPHERHAAGCQRCNEHGNVGLPARE